jgi:hypothetical protein
LSIVEGDQQVATPLPGYRKVEQIQGSTSGDRRVPFCQCRGTDQSRRPVDLAPPQSPLGRVFLDTSPSSHNGHTWCFFPEEFQMQGVPGLKKLKVIHLDRLAAGGHPRLHLVRE